MPQDNDERLCREVAAGQITMRPCEACSGTGVMKVTGFMHGKGGCRSLNNEPMRCIDCKGDGQVADLTLKMRRIGRFIRDYRVKMRISQKEQAELLGMTFSELNDIQHGRF